MLVIAQQQAAEQAKLTQISAIPWSKPAAPTATSSKLSLREIQEQEAKDQTTKQQKATLAAAIAGNLAPPATQAPSPVSAFLFRAMIHSLMHP